MICLYALPFYFFFWLFMHCHSSWQLHNVLQFLVLQQIGAMAGHKGVWCHILGPRLFQILIQTNLVLFVIFFQKKKHYFNMGYYRIQVKYPRKIVTVSVYHSVNYTVRKYSLSSPKPFYLVKVRFYNKCLHKCKWLRDFKYSAGLNHTHCTSSRTCAKATRM